MVTIKKTVFLFLVLFFAANCAAARHLHKEAYYQQNWCNDAGGVMEFTLDDNTRVDCLTDELAIEFDFANKWAECVGQAVYYGIKTNRRGACALIMENYEKDLKYLNRLNTAAEKADIEVIEVE